MYFQLANTSFFSLPLVSCCTLIHIWKKYISTVNKLQKYCTFTILIIKKTPDLDT
jgi:hypothetical protein